MKRNSMELILLLVAMLVFRVMTATAGATLSMKDFKVSSGNTYTVEVEMDNDVAIDAISGTLTLPEGLNYVDNSIALSSRVSTDFAIRYITSTKKFSIINYGTAKITAGAGSIFSFQVQAADLTGSVNIELSDLVASNASAQNVVTATTAKSQVSPISNTYELDADVSDLTLDVNDEKTITLSLTCPDVKVGAGMTITLPDGLEIVDGSAVKGAMLASTHSVAINKQESEAGVYNVVIISVLNDAFQTTYGELFSFKVKATKKIAEGKTIDISNIAISSKNGTEDAAEDLTIGVKTTEQPATSCTLTAASDEVTIAGIDGEETISLTLTRPAGIVAGSMTITLPNGLEIVDGTTAKGEMLTSSHAVSLTETDTEGQYNVVIISSANDEFAAEEAELFSFKVKGTGILATEAKIVVSNIAFSDKSGNEASADNVEISVLQTLDYKPGDVDGDGDVDEVDAQLILQVSAGLKTLNDLAQPAAINVPGGNSDALEVNAQIVLKYSVATEKPW